MRLARRHLNRWPAIRRVETMIVLHDDTARTNAPPSGSEIGRSFVLRYRPQKHGLTKRQLSGRRTVERAAEKGRLADLLLSHRDRRLSARVDVQRSQSEGPGLVGRRLGAFRPIRRQSVLWTATLAVGE